MNKPKKFHLHCCALDRECRSEMRGLMGGAPWRIELNTPWFHLGVALLPEDRYGHLSDDGRIKSRWVSFRSWPRPKP